MALLPLVITQAGRAALVNAEATGTNAVTIARVGVTAAVFVAADTLTALPGELKRISTIAGEATALDRINLVLRDDDEVAYSMRGFGLYLDSGELFAAYSSPQVVIEKSALASLLTTLDIAFTTPIAPVLQFGDMSWTNPAATTTRKGVSELATREETIAGEDHERVVTPFSLAGALERMAPLESPALAGKPTAPTPAEADEGNRISTKAYVDAAIASIANTFRADRRGDIVFRATTSVPDGAYECDGRAVSRTADAALFEVIGTAYGPGNGTTTFNIPDMRGEFPRGWDNGRGVDPGRVFGSFQADELKSHRHSLPSRDNPNAGDNWIEDADGSSTLRTAFTGYTGGDETRPRNIAGMFIIWR